MEEEAKLWQIFFHLIGDLSYYTMMTILTISWFEAYEKMKIWANHRKPSKIKILFWIWIPIQYTVYILYAWHYYLQNSLIREILVFIFTFFPTPILLWFYGSRVIGIVKRILEITGKHTDTIRLRNFKILRTVLVGLTMYRCTLMGFIIIYFDSYILFPFGLYSLFLFYFLFYV